MDIKKIIVDFLKWDCEVRYGTSVGYEDGISKKADDYLRQQLLQQTLVSGALPLETTLTNIVDDFCEMDVTACCGIGPIVSENYCPKCGKKIVGNDR